MKTHITCLWVALIVTWFGMAFENSRKDARIKDAEAHIGVLLGAAAGDVRIQKKMDGSFQIDYLNRETFDGEVTKK